MTLPAPGEWPVDGTLQIEARDLLAARAGATPDAPAVVDADRDRTYAYADLEERASAVAGWLSGHCSPGDRVGLLLETGMAFVDLLFASARTGTTAVPLNVRDEAGTLASQADRAGIVALVADERSGLAEEVAPRGVPILHAADRPTGGTVPTEAPGTHEDSERLIAFTSGTTGRPKGVRLTRGNLLASASASAWRLGVCPGDRWLVVLPTYHVGGLSPIVRSTLYGTAAVIRRSFDPGRMAATIRNRDVTGVSLVPTMLRRLLEWDWTPPETLRFVLLGGGPIHEGVVERATARGIPVAPTYGLTETASQVATATPEEAETVPGSVGRPLRTARVTVLDGDDPSGVGETGELVVDGPMVTPGYLDPDRTDRAFCEYGLRTGDRGSLDEDGRLWIAGRVDDLIVTGGENVSPDSVAARLRAVDGVRAAAVVGLPDEEWGERVAALVVSSRPGAEIREAARESQAAFEVPKTIEVTDELPRTPSGTVDRGAVREWLRAGTDDRNR